VQKITLKAGLISVLEFPKPIDEVRIGDPKSVKTHFSQAKPHELTLYLTSSHSKPTNLIVSAKKHTFILDLVPSANVHQDYVKIQNQPESLKLIEEVRLEPKAREHNKMPDNFIKVEKKVKL